MVRVARSRPQGQAACHECRRKARAKAQRDRDRAKAKRLKAKEAKPETRPRTCPACKERFTPKSPTQRFCTRRCWQTKNGTTPPKAKRPPKPKATTTERGYGPEHQKRRAEWAVKVEAGGVRCWRCNELIRPGQAWDLGHDDRYPGKKRYRGPEHASGNRRAGQAKATANKRRRSTPRVTGTTPLRW